jgi:tetratricopeptide (TPR) repeat protein
MKMLNFRVLILMFLFVSALFAQGCGCGNNRHYIKGRELYRDKDLAGAIEELKLAHKQQPKNVEIMSFMGRIYFENKDYDGALEMYSKELQLVPGDIQAHFNIAKVYKEKGDGALALEHFNKVVEINPGGKLAGEAQKLIPECSNLKPQTGAADPAGGGTNGSQASSGSQNKQGQSKKRATGF